ncbi:unnamed protein product [Trichobilharzia szidati]|nr:unnamed protein product [Trichobilharzia szidati]
MSLIIYFAVFTLLVGVVRTTPINITDSYVETSPRTFPVQKVNRLSDELSFQMKNLREGIKSASKMSIAESVCKACMELEKTAQTIPSSGYFSEHLRLLGSMLCGFAGVSEERCNSTVNQTPQTPITESMADNNETALCESVGLCYSEGNRASERVDEDGAGYYI